MTSIKLTNIIIMIHITTILMMTISRASDKPGKFSIFNFRKGYQKIEDTPPMPHENQEDQFGHTRKNYGTFDKTYEQYIQEKQDESSTKSSYRASNNERTITKSETSRGSSSTTKKDKTVKTEKEAKNQQDQYQLPPEIYGTFYETYDQYSQDDLSSKSSYQEYGKKFK